MELNFIEKQIIDFAKFLENKGIEIMPELRDVELIKEYSEQQNLYEKCGDADVDSGILMVADPCYFADGQKNKDLGEAYISSEKYSKQLNHDKGHAGLGVMITGFGGDGEYPVYRQTDEKGRTTAIIVDGIYF